MAGQGKRKKEIKLVIKIKQDKMPKFAKTSDISYNKMIQEM